MMLTWNFWEYWVAAAQLIFAMIGMGATLTVLDFRNILRRPHGVAFVFIFQYLICPFLAMGLARWFGLSPGMTLGLLVVAAMPSGAMSNIYTYLGRGNVPLSITATTASTLACLVLTPVLLRLLEPPGLPGDFQMPVFRILQEILFCLLIPLTIGMTIGHLWSDARRTVSKWSIRGCMLFLSILVVGSLFSGQIDVFEHGLKVPFVMILFGAILLGPVQILAFLLGFNEDDAYTIGIEITMRNCNVALLLKAAIWPVGVVLDEIGEGVLYAALFYGGMSLFLCLLPIIRRYVVRRHRTRNDAQPVSKKTDRPLSDGKQGNSQIG